MTSAVAATFARYAGGLRYAMHVHICPSFTRDVVAAKALMRLHASCVASPFGSGTAWKWSYTQIESKVSPWSACCARPFITAQWSRVSMPVRSCRQPCG